MTGTSYLDRMNAQLQLIDSFVVFVEPFYPLEENQEGFDKQFNLHGQWHFCGRVKQAAYHF